MIVWNVSLASGETGAPCEIVSVKPLMRNSVPSVVTKDGTRSFTVIAPLTRPISPDATSASRIAITSGMPACWPKYMTNGASAKTCPDGKIDLAADQQHDLAAGDDRGRRDELRQRLAGSRR